MLNGFYAVSSTRCKILDGANLIKVAILPIGQQSEEAVKSRNKHVRSFRLNHSRKFSRVACNIDVLKRRILTSDPQITDLRGNTNRTTKPSFSEVLYLLSKSDITNINILKDSNTDETAE